MKEKLIGISELIQRLKTDLLSATFSEDPKLFSIDEVTLELNFVISGNIDSGFNFGVVTLGSDIHEDRIQKITIKMTPLVSKEQLIENLNSLPNKAQATAQSSNEAILRGSHTTTRGGKV